MTRNLGNVVLAGVVFVILVAGQSAAALATHDLGHASAQMDQVEQQACLDMEALVAQFEVDAGTAATEQELAEMLNTVSVAVRHVRNGAVSDLASIRIGYPELQDAFSKKSANLADKLAAILETLSAIAAATVPGGGTTTTTLPPSTTTTQPPPTTTQPPPTTTPPSPTTTLAPSTTTTLSPTTTKAPGAITTTTVGVPGPSVVPVTPAPEAPDPPESVVPLDVTLSALPSSIQAAPPLTDSRSAISDKLHGGLSVVLPDVVASAVLSPLMVLEILVGTLLSSVRGLVIPSVLLIIFGVVISNNRRRKPPLLEPGEVQSGD